MSAAKNGKPKNEGVAEPRPATAEQLFSRYVKAVEKVRTLAQKLVLATKESENLSNELGARFGVFVSGKPLVAKARTEPVRNEGEGGPAVTGHDPETPYEPPVQMHSDAPHLTAKESQDVAKIRADAGLSPEQQADAEALETEAGPGRMTKLQAAMGGTPAVIPSPGAIEGVPEGPLDSGPDNTEGGPVTQRPIPEEE